MKAYYASLLPLEDDGGLPGDWYLIQFIDFPRAVTQARSLAECIAMGQDVLEIEGRNFVEKGRPLPEPSSYEAALAFTQEAMQEEGMDRARRPLVQIFALPDLRSTLLPWTSRSACPAGTCAALKPGRRVSALAGTNSWSGPPEPTGTRPTRSIRRRSAKAPAPV